MELFGCGTALVTPFGADGALDEAALVSLVDWQIQSGVELLVPCGTTGEAATLNEDEWLRVVEVTCAVAGGRVPVFAGCTHNSTREAVARVERVSRVPGLGGVLTANPYYNRPGQEGQYQHFKASRGGHGAAGAAVQHSGADGGEPGDGYGASVGGAAECGWY